MSVQGLQVIPMPGQPETGCSRSEGKTGLTAATWGQHPHTLRLKVTSIMPGHFTGRALGLEELVLKIF